jgi:putative SOS response-associated peptidase YedK
MSLDQAATHETLTLTRSNIGSQISFKPSLPRKHHGGGSDIDCQYACGQPSRMCNLYKMDHSAAEVAKLFNVAAELGNAGGEIYPGYPGYVVAQGRMRQMTWGFPLTLKSKKTGLPLKPKPVNNTRADKLDSFMWRYSFAERRCLIPATQFAEAEGEAGNKTRTWFALPDEPVFAVAGIWADTPNGAQLTRW